MEKKITIKERILQVAKYKGFTLDNFCNKIGLTYGNFKGKAKETPINSDAIVNILSIIPDINIEWLLTGEGPMLRNDDGSNDAKLAQVVPVVEQSCAQCAIKDKLIESQQATIEAQRETINLLKQELKACGNSKKPPLPDTLPAEVTAKLKKD